MISYSLKQRWPRAVWMIGIGLAALTIATLLGFSLGLIWQHRQIRLLRHQTQSDLLRQVESAAMSGETVDIQLLLESIIELDPNSEVGIEAKAMLASYSTWPRPSKTAPTFESTPTQPPATDLPSVTDQPEARATQTSSPRIHPHIYRIQPGDTLSGIAFDFDISVQELIDANPTIDFDRIYPGVQITIPINLHE